MVLEFRHHQSVKCPSQPFNAPVYIVGAKDFKLCAFKNCKYSDICWFVKP